MSFKRETTDLDFNETPIENIFINDFMPMANGTAVKVYLLAYKFTYESREYNNASISKHLNIPLIDVIRSWDFWEQKGIIKKIDNDDDDFDVLFLSLRQLIARGIYSTESRVIHKDVTNAKLTYIEAKKDPNIRKMFYEIDQTMRRELVPNEKNKVLDWIYNQNINIDIITRAFKYSVETRDIKNIKYIEAIVRGWHDKGILTSNDLEEHFEQSSSHYTSYKTVYKTLGYANKLPSAGDKEIINIWLDDYKLDIDFIVKVLTESSKRTANINMNYVHKIMTTLNENNIDTIEKYKEYLNSNNKAKTTNNNNKPNVTKNKFHDFKQRDNKYTDEELEKKLGVRK